MQSPSARRSHPRHAVRQEVAVAEDDRGALVAVTDASRGVRVEAGGVDGAAHGHRALEGLALVLGHYGARVSTAASSRDALAILLENPPHVIVADIGMPGEDGHAFLQTVRALSAERGGTIPAIALTAYAAPQDRLDTLHSGFELHIAKPVNPRDLAAAVATLAAIGGRLTPFERGSAARL